ncbi:MAG TPA: regulatory iron-sulfur-containing complex subunit RicT [Anaerolineae bacterium]|nr:regulatory iron-sulfur-containing complex subunit RicT [Anaerolineae bacterium]
MYEVEFKGSRKDYFLCPDRIPVKPMDFLIVQADRGEHIGRFIRYVDKSLFQNIKEMKSILRRATYTDIQIMMDNSHKEEEAFIVCKNKIEDHSLKMKLVDVEYQFDANKICFYFTADKRIDFRDLVKDLASEYRTRIELRQIGVRDEARRLGGLGVCGRQLCCKTFINQFETITSQMARDQNLSLSPSKISGLCGRLMCCLAFEENFYKIQSDILPQVAGIVEHNGIRYEVIKVDIFNENFIIKDEKNAEITVNIDDFTDFKIIESGFNHTNNTNSNSKIESIFESEDKSDEVEKSE